VKLLKDSHFSEVTRLAAKYVTQDEFDKWKGFLQNNGISDDIFKEEGYDMELASWVKDKKL
jgi:hypothetical protein